MLRHCAYRATCSLVTAAERMRSRAWQDIIDAGDDPDRMAYPRAFPWKTAFQGIGIVLTIGGGMLFVSTPALGGWIVGFGLLALVAGSIEGE